MVDGVDVVCSEGAAEDIKQTQGCSVKQAQGSFVKNMVEVLYRPRSRRRRGTLS